MEAHFRGQRLGSVGSLREQRQILRFVGVRVGGWGLGVAGGGGGGCGYFLGGWPHGGALGSPAAQDIASMA